MPTVLYFKRIKVMGFEVFSTFPNNMKYTYICGCIWDDKVTLLEIRTLKCRKEYLNAEKHT